MRLEDRIPGGHRRRGAGTRGPRGNYAPASHVLRTTDSIGRLRWRAPAKEPDYAVCTRHLRLPEGQGGVRADRRRALVLSRRAESLPRPLAQGPRRPDDSPASRARAHGGLADAQGGGRALSRVLRRCRRAGHRRLQPGQPGALQHVECRLRDRATRPAPAHRHQHRPLQLHGAAAVARYEPDRLHRDLEVRRHRRDAAADPDDPAAAVRRARARQCRPRAHRRDRADGQPAAPDRRAVRPPRAAARSGRRWPVFRSDDRRHAALPDRRARRRGGSRGGPGNPDADAGSRKPGREPARAGRRGVDRPGALPRHRHVGDAGLLRPARLAGPLVPAALGREPGQGRQGHDADLRRRPRRPAQSAPALAGRPAGQDVHGSGGPDRASGPPRGLRDA